MLARDLHFTLLTPERTAKLNKDKEDYVYFSLDEKGYTDLAAWLQDLKTYIQIINKENRELREALDYIKLQGVNNANDKNNGK